MEGKGWELCIALYPPTWKVRVENYAWHAMRMSMGENPCESQCGLLYYILELIKYLKLYIGTSVEKFIDDMLMVKEKE